MKYPKWDFDSIKQHQDEVARTHNQMWNVFRITWFVVGIISFALFIAFIVVAAHFIGRYW